MLGHLTEPPSRQARNLFRLAVLALTVLALAPLWLLRLLPMQDYPEHLFFSKVVATYSDPALDWSHYTMDLSVQPYALWYLAMKPLTALFGLEAAGRIMMSLYVALTAALALACERKAPRGSLPWGALLLFPFAFNQMYFLGFMNYILSIPFLFLMMFDLEEIAAGAWSRGRLIRHAIGLAILLLNHPYSLLFYVGLASVSSLAVWKDRKAFIRTLLPSLVVLGVLVAYYALRLSRPDQQARTGGARWWSFESLRGYYGVMFTGMRWFEGADVVTALFWLVAAAALLLSWQRHGRRSNAPRATLLMYLACLAGFLVLPFWYLYYSYLNVRLAPVSYFALAVLGARLFVGTRAGGIVAACAAGLLILSIRLQAMVSAEMGEILPAITAVPKNQLVLPLLFDTTSPDLDDAFFQEFHLHAPSYYMALVGGGAMPGLMHHPLAPVHFRPEATLPAPPTPEGFSWNVYGSQYDYFLVRAPPQLFIDYMLARTDLIVRSGPWLVFHNRRGPHAQP